VKICGNISSSDKRCLAERFDVNAEEQDNADTRVQMAVLEARLWHSVWKNMTVVLFMGLTELRDYPVNLFD
jgi:hypothetical protein